MDGPFVEVFNEAILKYGSQMSVYLSDNIYCETKLDVKLELSPMAARRHPPNASGLDYGCPNVTLSHNANKRLSSINDI